METYIVYIDPEVESNLINIRDLFYQMSNGNAKLEMDFEESFSFIKYWCLDRMEDMDKLEELQRKNGDL